MKKIIKSLLCLVVLLLFNLGCFNSACAVVKTPIAVKTYEQAISQIYSIVDDVSSQLYLNKTDESGVVYFLDKLEQMGIHGGIVRINSKLKGNGNLDYCVAINTVDRGIIFVTVVPKEMEVKDEEQRLQFVYLVNGEKVGLLTAKFTESNDYSWYESYLSDTYAFYDYCEYLAELSDLLDSLGKGIDNFRMMSMFSASVSQSDIDWVNRIIVEYNECVEDYNEQSKDLQSRADEYPEDIFYVEEYTIGLYSVPLIASPMYIPNPFPTAGQLANQMSHITNLDRDSFSVDRVTDKNFVVTGFSIKWR